MSETPARSIAKAVTWQVLGLAVMTLINWSVTGSVAKGGMIAALGAGCGLFTYVLHERAWAQVDWGRRASHERTHQQQPHQDWAAENH
ncbi:putative membrane protein [Aliiruegeria haliotis]|uniref:Putative membrane protein n=1 Tax=Aliiruegeria haliotis TaxID=1280846 RepID=A0A2T0RV15_9RHOB|nr:DUF2061 domain-containing protein [Aliiruegeria haliotis]PRY25039.1 putative membrane protein [Aliiruegeria haliotis]